MCVCVFVCAQIGASDYTCTIDNTSAYMSLICKVGFTCTANAFVDGYCKYNCILLNFAEYCKLILYIWFICDILVMIDND